MKNKLKMKIFKRNLNNLITINPKKNKKNLIQKAN